MFHDMSIAVLCGGRSSRFGSDKTVHIIDGKPLYRHVLDKVSRLSEDVFIQGGKSKEGVEGRTLEDLVEGMGPIGGIYSALCHSRQPRTFVLACDMPSLDVRVLDELVFAGEADIVVPRWRDGRTEPLCALYSKGVIPIAKSLIDGGKPKVAGLFRGVGRTTYLPVEILFEQGRLTADCFVNINEPKDLQFH